MLNVEYSKKQNKQTHTNNKPEVPVGKILPVTCILCLEKT